MFHCIQQLTVPRVSNPYAAWQVRVKFCIPYPLHVYAKIADAVASSLTVGII